MTTSTEEEAVPRRGKIGANVSWADVNLTELKNEENSHGRFNCYKWTIKFKAQ
jgi:hypothetical protein